jgi:hypothetical protein
VLGLPRRQWLSQFAGNFSGLVFRQFHSRFTQVLGRAFGVSVPDHPVAVGAPSGKEASKVSFVGHFPFAFRPPCALASVMFTFMARLHIAESLRFIAAAIAAAWFLAAANL